MVQDNKKLNLPWVEKYRPSTLDDLVSHEDIINTISKFIKEDQVPHLLFYGPPGTGKTSTILACARQLYTPAQFSSMVLELNASDDRGIGIVRGQILTFASTRTIFKSGFKLIILDEADAMTMDAQNALRRMKFYQPSPLNVLAFSKTSIIRRYCCEEFSRIYTQTIGAEFYIKRCTLPGKKNINIRITDVGGFETTEPMLNNYLFNADIVIIVYDITSLSTFESISYWLKCMDRSMGKRPICAIVGNKFIEKYTENIRFCIICNYLSKVIPALQSRCTRFRFGPLNPEQILPRLNYVVDQEKVKISEDGKMALLTLANGDMRKVLNVLQSTWLAYKDVTEDNVYTCVGHPLRVDIESIVKWLLNENFKNTYKYIKELKTVKGLALSDILTEAHKYVQRIEFPFDVMIDLLEKMAEIEYRLSIGADENHQLTALISAFSYAKELTPVQEEMDI